MPSGNGRNGMLLRWAVLLCFIASAIVGGTLYISEVRATTLANGGHVAELRANYALLEDRLELMEKRQVFFMVKMGISESEIPK